MFTPARSPPCTRSTRIFVAPWPGRRPRRPWWSNRTFFLASSASLRETGSRPGREFSTAPRKPTPSKSAGRAGRGGGQPHRSAGDAVRPGPLLHGLRHLIMIAVHDRDHTAARTAQRRAQRAGLLRRRDDIVEVGIGTGAARLMQPVVHGASDQGAIAL